MSKTSELNHAVSFSLMVPVLLSWGIVHAASTGTNPPHIIDVFISNGLPINGKNAITSGTSLGGTDLHVYHLNGIQLVETDLSKVLTGDPEQSKRLIMQRIQVLDEQSRARMRRSAIGLAMAMQYGVDRVPAIVFDGQAVVYGITDLQAALAYYQAWRTGDAL